VVERTSPRKVRRIFHCARCGHHLRLGAAHCGECHSATPFYNQARVWLLALVAVIGVGVVLTLR
jgi:hypothetical protein